MKFSKNLLDTLPGYQDRPLERVRYSNFSFRPLIEGILRTGENYGRRYMRSADRADYKESQEESILHDRNQRNESASICATRESLSAQTTDSSLLSGR